MKKHPYEIAKAFIILQKEWLNEEGKRAIAVLSDDALGSIDEGELMLVNVNELSGIIARRNKSTISKITLYSVDGVFDPEECESLIKDAEADIRDAQMIKELTTLRGTPPNPIPKPKPRPNGGAA